MPPEATREWKVLVHGVREGLVADPAGAGESGSLSGPRPPGEPASIDGAGDGVDWGAVASTAAAHGVTPLLARGLADCEAVPASVADPLRERSRARAARNLGLAGDLAAVADGLDAAGVRYLPFKGPVLAQAVYGDVSRRSFADLDLLVPRTEVRTAVDRLEADGFALVPARPRKDDAILLGGPLSRPLVQEYTLRRDGTELEVRWRVGHEGNRFPASVPALLDRAGRVEVGGRSVPALAPEDRLLVLAHHGTKHRWHLLKWVADVAAAVTASAVAWDDVIERAQAGGMERRVLLAVTLAGRVLDSPVPDAIRHRLAARDVGPLVETAAAKLRGGPETRPGGLERARFNARALDSRRAQLAMLAHLPRLHPSLPEYRLLPLPGWLHPLYYLVRPLRLAASRGRKLLGVG